MKRLSIAKSGDWNALDSYLRDVGQLPALTDEEAATLGARAAKGDVDAQESLVHSHLRLVVKIAHHYAGFGLPLADLVSEGNIGLIRAAELYDPKFGTKFSTYASVWIKQRMHRAITSQARAVRIPVWRSQRLRKLARLNEELSAQLGRTASDDELAERLGLSAEQMAGMQSDRFEVVSIDAPAHPGDENSPALHHALPDENAQEPGANLTREELVEELFVCLHDLEDRELEILSLKYGFQAKGAVSFRELGRRFGLSHEWVRRIGELAVVKVRRALENVGSLPAAERTRRMAKVQARIAQLASAH
jgi:RNA polymerase primary sigma factor